jgi:phage terminase large subunit-like protein
MNARMRQLGEMLAALEPHERRKLIRRLPPEMRRHVAHLFSTWAIDGQVPPPGDWRVWLILAGRGFGKTRAGAEWVTKVARKTGRIRIALVGATIEEARRVMVEGPAGLLAVAARGRTPKWEPSLNKLSFPSGAMAFLYSADNPESLRGPEHQFAWCDELAKWPDGERVWPNLMLGLRQGKHQRVVVTTTPRPVKLLKRLMADPKTARTGGRSRDNIHLPESFLEAVEGMYAGTRLGRQELDGELIEDVEGALWMRDVVEAARVDPPLRGVLGLSAVSQTAEDCVRGTQSCPNTGVAGRRGVGVRGSSQAVTPLHQPSAGPPPLAGEDLVRIVIGVDPPASSGGDACGIIVCGVDRGGIGYVLDDASVESTSPECWAAAVGAACEHWGADRIVAEANNGGDMVRSVLLTHDPALPVTLVHASRGKAARAEPVSLLYARGRVRHAGVFPELEDQMCGMTATGYQGPGRSPDRADALVWALTELMLKRRAVPRVWVM